MNEYQKVLFTQLQIAGLGIVVIIMGLLRYDALKIFIPIGAGIFLFGLIRFLILARILKNQASSTYELLDEQEKLYTEKKADFPLFDSEENAAERKDENSSDAGSKKPDDEHSRRSC